MLRVIIVSFHDPEVVGLGCDLDVYRINMGQQGRERHGWHNIESFE